MTDFFLQIGLSNACFSLILAILNLRYMRTRCCRQWSSLLARPSVRRQWQARSTAADSLKGDSR